MLRVYLLVALMALVNGPPSSTRMVVRQAWPDAPSGLPTAAVSADGRYVAFVSAARLMPSDTNVLDDIYLLDRDTHKLTIPTSA